MLVDHCIMDTILITNGVTLTGLSGKSKVAVHLTGNNDKQYDRYIAKSAIDSKV